MTFSLLMRCMIRLMLFCMEAFFLRRGGCEANVVLFQRPYRRYRQWYG